MTKYFDPQRAVFLPRSFLDKKKNTERKGRSSCPGGASFLIQLKLKHAPQAPGVTRRQASTQCAHNQRDHRIPHVSGV